MKILPPRGVLYVHSTFSCRISWSPTWEEGRILHGYLAILCGEAEFLFSPAGRSEKFYKARGISKTPKSTGSHVLYNNFCTSSSLDGCHLDNSQTTSLLSPLTSRSIFSIQPWRYYLSRQWKWSPFTSISDAIVGTVSNRHQSDRKMKNSIRIPWYRLSYSVINVDIADLASFHYITPRPSSTLFCRTSIAHTMDNIMRYN